jgi:hypothetical protein
MSQIVKVDRKLDFRDAATYSKNIYGHPFTEKSIFDEDFFVPQAYHGWVEEETNGGTIAWAAPHALTLTTGGVDNDVCELTHPSTWTGSRNAMVQFRAKMDGIATVGVNIGLVDADMSTNDQMCFEIGAGVATLTNARATNGVAFVFDTDGDPDYWYMCATKADVEGTPVSLAIAPVAATYAWFGIKLDSSGNATFYYNFKPVGYQAAAVGGTTALKPYVANIARTGAVRVATVDRFIGWQDEA